MSRRPDWIMVPTWWLEAKALPEPDDYLLPAWQRVAFLAMSRMRRDGHAHFASGELAKLLDMLPKNARRAVHEAVAKRWLSPSSLTSRMRCMVVPLDFTHGLGRYPAPCDLHAEKRGKPPQKDSGSESRDRENPPHRDSGSEYLGTQDLSPTPAESRGSEDVPSLILPNVPTANRTDGFGLDLFGARAHSLGRRGRLAS